MLKFWIHLILSSNLIILNLQLEINQQSYASSRVWKEKIGNKKRYDTIFSKSKTKTTINESNIADVFESIYTEVLSNIKKSLGKSSSWLCHSIIDHNINISRYNSLAGSSYFKLAKELDYRRAVINIQNIDNKECFKWCFVRCLFR